MFNLHKYVLEQDDPYDFLYECLSGAHGPDLMDMILEMYHDIAADYNLHPDDDFEKILDHMIYYMEVV